MKIEISKPNEQNYYDYDVVVYIPHHAGDPYINLDNLNPEDLENAITFTVDSNIVDDYKLFFNDVLNTSTSYALLDIGITKNSIYLKLIVKGQSKKKIILKILGALRKKFLINKSNLFRRLYLFFFVHRFKTKVLINSSLSKTSPPSNINGCDFQENVCHG